MKKTDLILPVLFLLAGILFTSIEAQSQERSTPPPRIPAIESTTAPGDTLAAGFYLTQAELFHLGDYDLTKWLSHMPHNWISRSPQPGQPQFLQGGAIPIWMTQIQWEGMQMVDPIYGLCDLNLIPMITIDTVRISENDFGVQIENEKSKTARAFSQVFVNAGYSQPYFLDADTKISDVNIAFRRGFAHGIRFGSGANFFKYGGIYPNSKVDAFQLRSSLDIPFSPKLFLQYRWLSNRVEAGYPGAIRADYLSEYLNLHRKLLRQDHLLTLSYKPDSFWEVQTRVSLHLDSREYTDWGFPWHTLETMRWGALVVSIRRTIPAGRSTFRAAVNSAYTRRSHFGSITEWPITLGLQHRQRIGRDSDIYFNASFTRHDSPWWDYRGEARWRTRNASGQTWNTWLFFRQQTPPLAWRNGRVMPFENQPWPLFLQQVDSTFVTPVHPRHPVKLAGVRLAVRWQATPTVQLHTDVLLQHIATLSFPTTGEKESIQFIPVAGFWFAGLFLNAAITVREGLGITARYQYSGFTKKDSPEFTEIPNHRLFFQLLLHRSFFHKNLNATALFSTELLGNRKSYGIGPGATRITVERLPAVPIFHLKLIFEIGDAEIFLYWFNFTNRLYSYRSLQPIPGWQFQYGVRWKFWD